MDCLRAETMLPKHHHIIRNVLTNKKLAFNDGLMICPEVLVLEE
jgi:hypothetical protein